MKAYLITTGILFTIIVVAHIWEIVDRGRLEASDFVVLGAGVALSGWAWTLVRKRREV
jgi:hypothetical protein